MKALTTLLALTFLSTAAHAAGVNACSSIFDDTAKVVLNLKVSVDDIGRQYYDRDFGPQRTESVVLKADGTVITTIRSLKHDDSTQIVTPIYEAHISSVETLLKQPLKKRVKSSMMMAAEYMANVGSGKASPVLKMNTWALDDIGESKYDTFLDRLEKEFSSNQGEVGAIEITVFSDGSALVEGIRQKRITENESDTIGYKLVTTGKRLESLMPQISSSRRMQTEMAEAVSRAARGEFVGDLSVDRSGFGS